MSSRSVLEIDLRKQGGRFFVEGVDTLRQGLSLLCQVNLDSYRRISGSIEKPPEFDPDRRDMKVENKD